MNILFVNTPSDIYGSSRSLIRLTQRLADDGNKVVVILDSNGPIIDYLQNENIEIYVDKYLCFFTRAKMKHPFELMRLIVSFPISVFKIIRIIRKHNIEIVHSNIALLLTGGVAAKLMRIPHIWHIREFFDDFPKMWKHYQKYMNIFSSKIICVSNSIEAQFKDKRKTLVINNGFPKEEFKKAKEERIEAFINKYNLQKKILVAVIGRIKFVRKGQEVFVKAAALLKDKYPDVIFLIVGTPFPDNEIHLHNLQRLIKELHVEKNVILTGEIKDIKVVYSAIDLCVLTSGAKEPFGGVVIEAMAMKKPVIGTNHGGTCDQIKNDETGYLVEPNNAIELAKVMEKLILNKKLRLKFGNNGYKRFVENFEFEPFYLKIHKVYSDLIKK